MVKKWEFYAFHLNGEIAARGKFLHDKKLVFGQNSTIQGKRKEKLIIMKI